MNVSMLDELSRAPRRAVRRGSIVAVRGTIIKARLPYATLGEQVTIETERMAPLAAIVRGFEDSLVMLAPLGDIGGVATNSRVVARGEPLTVSVPAQPLGKILNAQGLPLNGLSADRQLRTALHAQPPASVGRPIIREQLHTGVRAIDLCVPLGVGQRMGLFAGAGVGKSTLLGMIARHTAADVSVIGLIGERGREVEEFISDALGHEGLQRSTLVVATSDEAPMQRLTAALTATAIAERYRHMGKRVLLMIDSLTRVARAMREIGLAAGELPVRQGYTPSVFTELPKLLERAGIDGNGSITALYTILSTTEHEPDPLAEEVKSLLDGHLILSQSLAEKGLRPAIDIVGSVSRVAHKLFEDAPEHLHAIQRARSAVAHARRDRDIALLGGTSDAALNRATRIERELEELLTQHPHERCSTDDRKRFRQILTGSD